MIGIGLSVALALGVTVQGEDPVQANPVQSVSDALERGAAAEAADDPHALAEAAGTLDALGARPAEAGTDVIKRWRELAAARGVVLPILRGRALGPAYRQGVLDSRATLTTEQVFLAGQKAEVALVPESGRTLDFRIVASDNNNICDRPAAAPRAVCTWLPVFTRRVAIRITNPADKPVRYFLVSN
ncbi:MAG: hypothetical protein JWN66_4960 [Sphingomonas bacterium]|uniref:hypothetical protein n=1 Tax=Sphingomonas bacterium TaxID=1895847 RepID=UPI00262E3071|nr:hypothetical protein [Sphingomonas bacterium]MDB5707844.1 hypothetical protein [Sphingomonas bacterium]